MVGMSDGLNETFESFKSSIQNVKLPLWPRGGISMHLGAEQVVSLIPGSVGYTSYPMFLKPTITWVSSGLSGDIWLDTKIVLKKPSSLQMNYC